MGPQVFEQSLFLFLKNLNPSRLFFFAEISLVNRRVARGEIFSLDVEFVLFEERHR